MKALLLGGRGAVGTVVGRELTRAGHSVTIASRSAVIPVDLYGDLAGLSTLAADYDVVINASGVERAELAAAVDHTPLVDISATGRYLADLRAAARGPVLLGAGLAPGLSTILASTVATPGADVDVFVMLGAGEKHGDAAVEWTEGLVGTDVYGQPEPAPVRNLRESRRETDPDGKRRRYLRADFPDHVLLGGPDGPVIRSYLTLTSGLLTTSLSVVGRIPFLRPTLHWAPPIGSDGWHVIAINRDTGTRAEASGFGQSEATGRLTALAAERLAAIPASANRGVTMAEHVSLADAREALGS